MKKNDMNLYERYRSENNIKANYTSPIRLYLAIIIAAVLIVGAYSAKLIIDNLVIKNNITNLEQYVNNTEIVTQMDEISQIQSNISRLNEIETSVSGLNAVLDYIPRYDSVILDIIYYEKPAAITYTTLTYSDNTISIEFTAPKSSDASNFALSLQRTKKFADVSYEGYEYDSVTNLYRGVLVCIMEGEN